MIFLQPINKDKPNNLINSNQNLFLSFFQKTGLPWGSSDTKPGAGGAGAATGGGGTQGLAHWMSMMAEHMNQESASSLHPAYMWHNGIDQKMSLSEQQLLQKGTYCTLVLVVQLDKNIQTHHI